MDKSIISQGGTSNTALKSEKEFKSRACLDYLRVAFDENETQWVLKLCTGYWGGKFEHSQNGTREYVNLHRNENGIAITSGLRTRQFKDLDNEKLADRGRLELKGDHLAELGERIVPFIAELNKIQSLKCTRLDAALDVFDLVTVSQIHRAAERHQFSGFHRDGLNYMVAGAGGEKGETQYFGYNSKVKRYRCYDKRKELENNGRKTHILEETRKQIDFTQWVRFEVELRGERSQQAFECLAILDTYAEIQEGCRGLAIGSIDFRHRGKKPAFQDCPQLSWWKKIVSNTEPVRTYHIPNPSHFVRLSRWFSRYCSKPLLAILHTFTKSDKGLDEFWKYFYSILEKQEANVCNNTLFKALVTTGTQVLNHSSYNLELIL